MEGNSNWKPNEQGGDSLPSNANDSRSQVNTDLRKRVCFAIVEKLKICFPTHSQNDIKKTALTFEGKIHGMASDKDDYLRKIEEKITVFERKFRTGQSNNVQSGPSVNGTNTPDPAAQVLNQGQSLPTSLPYTQTPTSQQRLPQNNIQSNLNIPESSGLRTQVSITVSAAQNVNIQMGEGVHSNLLPGSERQIQGREHLPPQQQQPQQQSQSSNYFRNQMDQQQLLKEKIRLRPPYMQQQAQQQQQQQHHQQSLLKQPIQQQVPHQTSLSNIQQSFPHSSALSSLPSSGQQNSQFLPRHQLPTQRVHSSHQQQMAVPSEQKRQERDQLISQLMNGHDTKQNHLTSRQNNGEQQGDFRVSSQQNSMPSFQEMAQNNNNLQNMHQQQRLYSHSYNASALPSQQQQYIPSGQSGNYNVHESSLLGTQGQEVGQSQPMMRQQYQTQHAVQQQQPQSRILHQHLDDTQRFQAAGSLHQTLNVADQQNQPFQIQRNPPENPSTSQDSTGKTVNANDGDWQEETYQKIKALKEKYLPVLTTLFQKLSDKLRQIDSLPQQNMQYESIQKLRAGISTLELVIVFLNVRRTGVTETHRDRFSMYEEQVLRFTKFQQAGTRRPMQQQQQGQLPSPQIHQTSLQSQSGQRHVSQSLDSDQMNSRLMPSHQNRASSSVSGLTTSHTAMPQSLQTKPKMEPKDENNIMSSSGPVALPILKQDPASNPQTAQSSMFQQKQFHHLPVQQQVLQRQQQQPQKNHQQLQIPKSEMNDVRMRQGVNNKAGLLEQHLSSCQRQLVKPLASPARMSNVSPSSSSPQIQNHSSPQLVDHHILPTTFNKTGTSAQSGGSPFVAPSPVTSFVPSPNPGDPEMPISIESPVSHAQDHPLFNLPPEPNAERPIDRLIKAFQSSSPESLAQSVSEMSSVISLTDMLAAPVHSMGGFRAGVAEDLSARTRFRLQQREANPKRFKRSISTMPVDIASETDSYKQFSSLESEVDSTASSGSKVNKVEQPNCALLQEIIEINGRLVETAVSVCNEDVSLSASSGIIVTCSYSPVALSATFEALYKSGHISQIQPLRLLVPADYPHSPILIENIPFDASVHIYEDLSARTRSRFGLSMKGFSEPMSLTEIAQAWDDCARATMAEYAERHGGGTFSSKYGHWEPVLRAS